MSEFKGYYGKMRNSGRYVYVINSGIQPNGEPALKVKYGKLGAAFGGGGMSIGQQIQISGEAVWVKAEAVERLSKGRNGVIWN